ncbi:MULTISPECIES: hypothetical protein [Legionella]|uniref:Uncharacterized protein n=1 Tax=Legionella steelei TaxID=947033 RepID=A0A0W0ZMY6_9GAMM|nr:MULTISPECIES: hypothetical protein [Legionella]KTD70370.1 hypothetical protein Lste_0621 [Legionella steelei]MBN9225704.1 hypothetical protein [Legionella steelei]OJW12255.1 MAG: hypothetical protein BGO44_07270 [Legionella sp. 39-23]
MLTNYHIRLLLDECREMGWNGLDNGVTASMPQLQVDLVEPPHDFLGVKGNPAVFINKDTYKLLGHLHENWVVNQTIALKTSFLKQQTVNIIGALVHEAGHAFNVSAKIANNEANAYIYEIEVMLKLLETNSPLLFGCTNNDIKSYFNERLPFYNKEISKNKYLAKLVDFIEEQFKLKEETLLSKDSKRISIFLTGVTLFTHSHWNKENEIVSSKMRCNASYHKS